METEPVALPPETLEGWYTLHQLFTIDRAALRDATAADRQKMVGDRTLLGDVVKHEQENGWSVAVRLIGSSADVMVMHARPTLDAIGVAQRCAAGAQMRRVLTPAYSFLSVTEAGMYHLTAKLAKEAAERGGQVGDAQYREALEAKLDAERGSDHVQRRLFPPLPPDMPYVCFYPMSKRRETGQNWYTLTLDERSRLMWSHGLTGRRYSGRVLQIITGAIGFEPWEWGVTLFAKDPLDFKKLVTEMRFDEASAKYADFGPFYVGKRAALEDLLD